LWERVGMNSARARVKRVRWSWCFVLLEEAERGRRLVVRRRRERRSRAGTEDIREVEHRARRAGNNCSCAGDGRVTERLATILAFCPQKVKRKKRSTTAIPASIRNDT
jgi:hypothetical protein